MNSENTEMNNVRNALTGKWCPMAAVPRFYKGKQLDWCVVGENNGEGDYAALQHRFLCLCPISALVHFILTPFYEVLPLDGSP